jgi:hypothetical protein
MLVSRTKPLRSFVSSGPPACGIDGCINQPTGGFEESIEEVSGGPAAALLPGIRLFWCRRHQFQLEARTIVKPGRRISGGEIDTLFGLE